MIKKKLIRPFEKKESGYHLHAKNDLAKWVGGEVEKEFFVEGSIAFVPDVTVTENNVITALYEVVHSHPIDGKKLGMIQMWCYRNFTELSIFEVSADYILKQTTKPDVIETMSCYEISIE